MQLDPWCIQQTHVPRTKVKIDRNRALLKTHRPRRDYLDIIFTACVGTLEVEQPNDNNDGFVVAGHRQGAVVGLGERVRKSHHGRGLSLAEVQDAGGIGQTQVPEEICQKKAETPKWSHVRTNAQSTGSNPCQDDRGSPQVRCGEGTT